MEKRILTLGLLSMALFSCAEKNVGPTQSSVSISATLENGREWNSGDEVLINGATYTIADGAGTSLATIDGVDAADRYCAAYDFGSGKVDGNTLSFSIPSTRSAGHSISRPMVASNKNTLLSFKYLLGTLRLSFTGTSADLSKIILSTSDGKALCGDAEVNLDFSGAPALSLTGNGGSVLTVEFPDGLAVGEGSVDVDLPAGSYNSLLLTAYGKDGNVMTAKSVPSVEIKRGEASDAAVEYVPDAEPPVYISAQLETSADGKTNLWTSSSVLFVNGLPATLYEGEGSASGMFGPVKASDSYFVSTSSASSGSVSSIVRTEIPSVQYYGRSLSQTNPAAGVAADKSVSLRYVAGVVSVTLKGSHDVREAELLSKSGVRLSGSGVINLDVTDFALSLNADAKDNVLLNCGAGVDAAGGAEFIFVVPAGEYSDGFTFIATDSKGQVFNIDIPSVSVSRNQLTKAGSFDWASDASGDNDLSLRGYANCYMVCSEGAYSFATSKVNNSKINGIQSADWLWATKVDGAEGNALISDVKYENGRISFNASSNKGNALIAAFDKDGNIVWSWHIWMTDLPQVFDYENNPIYQSGGKTNGFYVMDRNLGAVGTKGDDAFGLFYQWGRKDPFIGDTENEYMVRDDAETVIKLEAFSRGDNFVVRNTKYSQAIWQSVPCTKEVGSIEYATAHPMCFIYSGEDSNVANWLVEENVSYDIWWYEDRTLWTPDEKAVYDPCPVGYQVPKNRTFETLKSCGPEYSDNQGVTFTLSEGVTIWFPYQGYRSAHSDEKGALTYTRMPNGQVEVWTSHYSTKEFAYSFLVSKPAVLNYDNTDPWANGLNVRCVKAY